MSGTWAPFLEADAGAWLEARRRARGGPRVLMATSTGGYNLVTVLEGLVAAALTVRGVDVAFLLCDRDLPACLRANVHSIGEDEMAVAGLSRKLCPTCWTDGEATVGALGLPVLAQSRLIRDAERREAARVASHTPFESIGRLRYEGLSVGEHALAGALRYYARGDLVEEPRREAVLRRYLEASMLGSFALRRALREDGFQAVVFNHGIYVPFGVFGEVARIEGRRVVNWCASYRRLTFIFSHGDTYHHTLKDEPISSWEGMPWSAERDREIGDYLRSRWQGTRDWIYFHEKPEERLDAILADLGVDRGKPIVGLLTNVIWDAQLHYPSNAFSGIVEWAFETVCYFERRPDLQLVIRVHPAEVRGTIPSRQRMQDELKRRFPRLPSNVFLIAPESPISTYAVLQACNAALIYGTKMGVELTAVGLPVIVGGEAWIRNKGLTLDATSADQYRALLDRLPFPGPLDATTRERARRYAYHFFFRRMIPLYRVLEEDKGPALVRVTARCVDDLAPGRDPGLDVICDGILFGRPFVYDGPAVEPARGDAA